MGARDSKKCTVCRRPVKGHKGKSGKGNCKQVPLEESLDSDISVNNRRAMETRSQGRNAAQMSVAGSSTENQTVARQFQTDAFQQNQTNGSQGTVTVRQLNSQAAGGQETISGGQIPVAVSQLVSNRNVIGNGNVSQTAENSRNVINLDGNSASVSTNSVVNGHIQAPNQGITACSRDSQLQPNSQASITFDRSGQVNFAGGSQSAPGQMNSQAHQSGSSADIQALLQQISILNQNVTRIATSSGTSNISGGQNSLLNIGTYQTSDSGIRQSIVGANQPSTDRTAPLSQPVRQHQSLSIPIAQPSSVATSYVLPIGLANQGSSLPSASGLDARQGSVIGLGSVDGLQNIRRLPPIDGIQEKSIRSAIIGEFCELNEYLDQTGVKVNEKHEIQQYCDSSGNVRYKTVNNARRVVDYESWMEAFTNYEYTMVAAHGAMVYHSFAKYRMFIHKHVKKYQWHKLYEFDLAHRGSLAGRSIHLEHIDTVMLATILDCTAIRNAQPTGSYARQRQDTKYQGKYQPRQKQTCRNFNTVGCSYVGCTREHRCPICYGTLPWSECSVRGKCSQSGRPNQPGRT